MSLNKELLLQVVGSRLKDVDYDRVSLEFEVKSLSSKVDFSKTIERLVKKYSQVKDSPVGFSLSKNLDFSRKW